MSGSDQYQAAVSLIDSGDRAAGIQMLRRLVAHDPTQAKAWESLGWALYGGGNVAEAVRCFSAALEVNAELFDARLGLVTATDEQEDYAVSEAAYRALLAERPDDAVTLNFLANFLATRGRFDEAIALCEQTFRVDPEHIPTLRCYAKVLSVVGRDKEAEEVFLRGLALDPGNRFTRYAYGRFLLQFEDCEAEALEQLEIAEEAGEERATGLIAKLTEGPSSGRRVKK
jgi:tetratricopeptide (TPR) repeat protein